MNDAKLYYMDEVYFWIDYQYKPADIELEQIVSDNKERFMDEFMLGTSAEIAVELVMEG